MTFCLESFIWTTEVATHHWESITGRTEWSPSQRWCPKEVPSDIEIKKIKKTFTVVTHSFHLTTLQLVGTRNCWRLLADKVTLRTHSDKWKCHTKVKHGFEAALLYCVLHVRWAHTYLARLSWWLSWLGSCTRLPPGSPGPRPFHWRSLEGGEWGEEVRRKGCRTERERRRWRVKRRKKQGKREKEERGDDILVNEHVHNAQN